MNGNFELKFPNPEQTELDGNTWALKVDASQGSAA